MIWALFKITSEELNWKKNSRIQESYKVHFIVYAKCKVIRKININIFFCWLIRITEACLLILLYLRFMENYIILYTTKKLLQLSNNLFIHNSL